MRAPLSEAPFLCLDVRLQGCHNWQPACTVEEKVVQAYFAVHGASLAEARKLSSLTCCILEKLGISVDDITVQLQNPQRICRCGPHSIPLSQKVRLPSRHGELTAGAAHGRARRCVSCSNVR